MKSRIIPWILICLLCLVLLAGCSDQSSQTNTLTMTNVSYDPTRELYSAYNAMFAEKWKEKNGQDVEITQSHGGSGSQAISVSQGLEADVVTLALEADVQAIANAGLIREGWKDAFDRDSAPYTSTIVFLVRAGNPKNIKDWDDLAREGVGVITPNPRTSGAARWNFLAAWAYGQEHYGEDEKVLRKFVGDIYHNVLVLDSGARGATTSFAENGQGDVLVSWENEAMLTVHEHPEEYEIVIPSSSILCQPSVAVVDEVVDKRGTRELATAYLQGLYTEEAQKLAAENFYRPSDTAILQQYADVFDLNVKMTDISHFGGWKAAQEYFFSDGGIFDQIYEK